MSEALIWAQPKLERLEVTALTESRGFGRDRDDRDQHGTRSGGWNQSRGRRRDREDS